jgi:hypothetical protein
MKTASPPLCYYPGRRATRIGLPLCLFCDKPIESGLGFKDNIGEEWHWGCASQALGAAAGNFLTFGQGGANFEQSQRIALDFALSNAGIKADCLESILTSIVAICQEGHRVSFEEDLEGNTLTLSVDDAHTHVGHPDASLMELGDSLASALRSHPAANTVARRQGGALSWVKEE